MAFALYPPNFLPAGSVVVPQQIYHDLNSASFNSGARIAFFDNGVPGVSLARAIAGTHLLSEAKDGAPLMQSTRIMLHVNVSYQQPNATDCGDNF